MKKRTAQTVVCQICRKKKALTRVMPAKLIPGPLLASIRRQYPDWSSEGYVCLVDLTQLRSTSVNQILEQTKGDLSTLEQRVMDGLKEHDTLSNNINTEFEQNLTLGERLADKFADFGGSWLFIIVFSALLVLWVAVNSVFMIMKPFDPYPYILLNLVLSCLAAIQAPVIMMSQNRQESKDRLRAEYDYRVNLKAELEIRSLHDKLDYLLMDHWMRLLKVQENQKGLSELVSRKAHPIHGRN